MTTFKQSEEITVHDEPIKNIIALMVEKRSLESQYGWQSCFDVPQAYDRMDEVSTEIDNLINETFLDEFRSMYNEITFDNVKEALDTIAFDASNNNVDLETNEIHFYDRSDYIDTYITSNFDTGQQQIFDSLYHWMSSDDRGKWLEANYLNDGGEYTDNRVNFVIIVTR